MVQFLFAAPNGAILVVYFLLLEKTHDTRRKNVKLENNSEILEIISPKKSVRGPYVVVYKDTDKRWAIVAMDWDSEPRLGIRWFWDKQGYPVGISGSPVWYVIPPQLSKSILAGLPIDHTFSTKIDKFLAGELTGQELME